MELEKVVCRTERIRALRSIKINPQTKEGLYIEQINGVANSIVKYGVMCRRKMNDYMRMDGVYSV